MAFDFQRGGGVKIKATLAIVALISLGAAWLYSATEFTPDNVILEIPSDTGDYTLQCTVGMRIIDRNGNLIYETVDGDETPKFYETMLNSGIVWEDDSGEHVFTGKALRKELLKVLRRVLLGI